MSDDKEKGVHVATGSVVRVPSPTPKAISAQSQARNSYTRIVVLGVLLLLLCVALFVSLAVRPEHVKDLLLVISSIAAYLAGSNDFARRDER